MNTGTRQYSWTAGRDGCVYVLCMYMCVCVRENRNKEADVHQQPTFIFIM